MKRSLGETLAQLRREAGLSQAELAARLTRRGSAVSNQALSKWERDQTQPSAGQFLALCAELGVRDVLQVFTGSAGDTPYASLNRVGRAKVEDYILDLAASGRYADAPPRRVRRLPLYDIAASAGTGQYLDSSASELVEADGSVPAEADYGVRIAGDSMEPLLTDGQIVWVQRQEELVSGEIGLFLLDGSSYCKRLLRTAQRTALESLNPAYPPIPVTETSQLRVMGRVVGIPHSF